MLYPSLISALFKAYPKTGSAFLYSTVVRPRVLKGNLAVGFKKGPQIAVFARPYRSMPLLRRYLKGWAGLAAPAAPIADQILKIGRGASRDIAVETIERFPESVDALWERIRGALGLAAVRRAEFLNWRFFGDSGRDYGVFLAMRAGTPVGYVALREMQMREFRTLAVVDILFAPADREAADALLARVHAEAKVRKVDLVSAALNPDSPFRLYLARWGFLRTPEAFTLITHEPSHANRLAGREAADWHLTWFDHDYV